MKQMHWKAKLGVGVAALALPLAGQISRTLLDGATPPAIQAGTADGAWALSKIEAINLFSGSAALTIPLVGAGGRGEVRFTPTLALQQRWIVRATQTSAESSNILYPQMRTTRAQDMGYGMPVMERRNDLEQAWCPGISGGANSYVAYSITRLHWVDGDGSDVELVDAATNGTSQPLQTCVGGSVNGGTPFNRGTVFVSKDGTSMTFVAAADVMDGGTTGSYNIDGTLYKKDGTRYRMEGGKLRWISDRHGNLTTFEYGGTDPWGRVQKVKDSLGREISIDYGVAGNHPGEDRISYPGYLSANSSTARTVYVRYGSLSNLLAGGETLKKVKELFPDTAYADQPNVNNDDHNPTLPSELELADGSKFNFKYNSFGELAETSLPAGGIVKYTWAGYTTAGDGLYGDLLIYRRLKTRTVYESDGTTLLSWTEYSCPNLQQQTGNLVVSVTEKDATGGAVRVTEHTFAGNALGAAAFPPLGYPGWREGRELSTVTKIPNSPATRTVTQVWQQRGPSNTSITPASESAAPNDPRITQTSTTLGALTAVRTLAYSVDEHNNVTQECERDFGASSATRCVDRTYKTETAYTAVPVHLRGLVASEAITRFLPAPQATEATVTYEYDGTSATIYPDIEQFDPSRISDYATRGNITKETRNWPEGPAPAITEVTYDIAGNVVKVKTPAVEVEAGGNVGETVLSYADSYLDAAGKSTYAFPTTVTNALGQEQSRAYHWGAARMITATDVNGQSTTYSYADGLDRLTAADPPIGRSEFAYDRVNRTIQTKQRLTPAAAPGWVTQTVNYDGLGRTVRTTDAAGVVHAQEYDALGRLWKVWNPGQTAPSAEHTATAYDVLDRPVTVTYADGSVERVCYANNETVRVDAAGKWTKTVQDGLGRLSSVVEDPTAACQGQTRSGGLGLVTSYVYNARDLLTEVNQGGQVRRFGYDSLGRLTSAWNPESGTASYAYDAVGNLKTRSLSGRTVALKYDLLGRVLRKTYTDTSNTPEVVYCYDGDTQRSGCAAAPAGAGQNLAGRLTLVANAVASVKYGPYDGLGRVTNHAVVMDGQTYSFQYGYHELGLKKEVYPGGREVSYGFDGAGRVTEVTETSSDVFVSNYASGITYEASGAMRRMVLGNTKVQDQCYNQRLQLTGLRVGDAGDSTCQSGSGMVLGLGVGYGSGNNGNVASQSIQIGAGAVGAQSYTYDALNRLKTAVETRAAGGVAWTQTYVYDRHGNRAVLGASVPAPATGIPQVTVDDSAEVTGLLRTREDPVTQAAVVTNQWQSASVDEAGNVTAPKTGAYPHTLEYDGENRLVSAVTGVTGTMTAAYDGEGRRVKKTENGVVTVYVHDAAGRLAQEYGGAASGVSGRQYLVGDHLGSTRLTMNGTGVVRRDYYPFGEEVEAGTGDRTTGQGYQTAGVAADGMRVRFTGKERDAETTLDYFGARYMSSAQGRFTSPDTPLLDQDPGDPQSWNLYSYVRNNPLIITDPTGNDCVYVNSGGTGIDSIDNQGTSKQCGKTGGYWVDGTVTQARFAHGSLILTGTTNGEDRTSASYGIAPDPGLLALQRGTQMAEPGVNLAGQGLMLFGSIVAPVPMAIAQYAAGNGSKADVAMAMLPLPRGALKVLGTLAPLAETTVANAVKLRGGGGAQVGKIATWLQQMPLGEVAKLAADGNAEARTAIKIVKDASRLAQK